MRIIFVGVGALGSYFGGALAEAGHDVTLLIRNKAHRDAIRADGLILHRDSVAARIDLEQTRKSRLQASKNAGPNFWEVLG
ncbi:MAG: 2-dehydropantoate 2-reductase N-terminal domain-containing protein [Pseudomonadota bacterium]|nr:2-dehydropantoate 2-reductase N-terminal domain-containing protein [Pseudomonadota bacterium]